ncbi:MAG: hypothetical protein JJU33_01850 [Phycisphaerales bacterium]|nr:hypothetical protein [Phycisphaerales bacterium]
MREALDAIGRDSLDRHRWIDRAVRRPWWVGVPVIAARASLVFAPLLLIMFVGMPIAMSRIDPDTSLRPQWGGTLLALLFVLPMLSVMGYIGGRRAVKAGHFRRETRRWVIEHATWTVCIGVGIAFLLMPLIALWSPFGTLWQASFCVAFMMVVFCAQIDRRGSAISCTLCGYAYTPHPARRCTECGAEWLKHRGLAQGSKFKPITRLRIPVLGLVGMFFLGSIISGFVGPDFASKWVLPSMSDDALVSRIVRDPATLGSAEFIELSRRELSEAQVERLATALLDPERAPGRRAVSEVNWLLEQFESGTLPEPLVERFEQSIARGEILRLLPRATVGFTLSPSVSITPRWEQMGRYDTLIAFAGMTYGIGDAPSVIGQSGTPLAQSSEFVRLSSNPRFNPVFRAPAGGELVLRAEWFVVLVPPGTPVPPLVWRDDNTIDPPADAVHIFRGNAEGVIPIVP